MVPNSHYLDFYIDVPPYTREPHLRLKLGNYAITSVGIVVHRGNLDFIGNPENANLSSEESHG